MYYRASGICYRASGICRSFDNHIYIIWFANRLMMSIPDEVYSSNASIYTILLHVFSSFMSNWQKFKLLFIYLNRHMLWYASNLYNICISRYADVVKHQWHSSIFISSIIAFLKIDCPSLLDKKKQYHQLGYCGVGIF